MAIRSLRVAVIEPVGGHGGMDYYDFGLCGGVSAAGADVALYTCDETHRQEATFSVHRSFRQIYGKAATWLRGLRYCAGLLQTMGSVLRERRRICHFHFFHVGILQIAGLVLARLLFRKVVITAHDVESFVDALEVPRLSKWAYAMAHRIIAHNQTSRAELVARLGVEPARIRVIPHGNYIRFLPALPPQSAARVKLGLDSSSYVVLFFGQIKKVKGLDVLLRAIMKLAPTHPKLRLLVAGRPWHAQFSEYQGMIDKLGLGSCCDLHIRYISNWEVADFFSASDVVVLPYRRIYQSGVLLMAMSYAKLVIASDLPGMTEVAHHGQTGMIFPVEDEKALAENLRVAMENPGQCGTISQAGYEYVRKHHDWYLIGEKTCAVYRELELCVNS